MYALIGIGKQAVRLDVDWRTQLVHIFDQLPSVTREGNATYIALHHGLAPLLRDNVTTRH
jgi:hypothetical protein